MPAGSNSSGSPSRPTLGAYKKGCAEHGASTAHCLLLKLAVPIAGRRGRARGSNPSRRRTSVTRTVRTVTGAVAAQRSCANRLWRAGPSATASGASLPYGLAIECQCMAMDWTTR